jgi:hypothetical protein
LWKENKLVAITGTTLDKGVYFYQAIASGKLIAKDKIVVIKYFFFLTLLPLQTKIQNEF